jgi:hypothetical protein
MSETMLYKFPGKHEIHGSLFDYIITEDVEAAQADGWSLTTPEAKAAYIAAQDAAAAAKEDEAEKAAAAALADDTPPTRAELEQMAKSLSLPFDGRTSDKKLSALITAASAAAEQPAA